MSLVVSPWLPPASRADLEALLRRVVERWLSDWIVGPVNIEVVTPARLEGEVGDWRGNSGRRLHIAEEDLIALGVAACEGRADRINPVDREFLTGIGNEMLDELTVRFCAEAESTAVHGRSNAGPCRDGLDGAEHQFRITALADGWSLLIVLDESVIVRLRKSVAGSARAPALVPLSNALASESVRLGCHLGQTQITAAELATLAAGDVLVLDRRLDAPVPLTIEGKRSRTGKARVGAQATSIEVKLTEPIDAMQEM